MLRDAFWKSRPCRTPLVMQTEAAECGLACLAMIAQYNGHDVDLGNLRRRHPSSPRGLRLTDLAEIAAELQLSGRPVKFDLPALELLALPAVLHWDFNHFVVLTRVHASTVEILDPASGRKRLSREEFSVHFTGAALELQPRSDFEPRNERRHVRFGQLLGNWRSFTARGGQVLGLSVLLEIGGLLAPMYSQLAIDRAVALDNRVLLWRLGVGFLLLAGLQAALAVTRSWLMTSLNVQVNLKMLERLFGHLIRLPITFFERRHLGDITSRFESLNAIQRILTSGFILSLLDGVTAIATLVLMLFYNAYLSLIVLASACAMVFVRAVLYRAHRMAIQEQIARGADQQNHLLESIRGAQSIKLFVREASRSGSWNGLAVATANSTLRAQRFSVGYQAANMLLSGVENVLVIGLGALAILNGTMTVGRLFAFIAVKLQFMTRVSSLVERGADYSMLALHRERVGDIVLEDVEIEGGQASVRATGEPAAISLIDVSFRYSPSSPLVLDRVSLHIEAGEFVAITGASGCGKTTLVKILLGLLQPTSGQVLIDGRPLNEHGVRTWRASTGTVMQEDVLFAGSITDNICFFDSQPDFARVRECAELASIANDIESMPMGFETLIGDMGGLLSGGQRQRVLLARAFYRKPRVLVLDEATSHLDGQRESQVNAAIRNIPLTRIIVAHRTETIRAARRVIRLPEDCTAVAAMAATEATLG